LHLQGEVIVIGDGYTDYEIREAGQASKFYLFVENVQRTHLFDKADRVVTCLEDFI
jgi:D-3-phosphoglycerate dehydrogenase